MESAKFSFSPSRSPTSWALLSPGSLSPRPQVSQPRGVRQSLYLAIIVGVTLLLLSTTMLNFAQLRHNAKHKWQFEYLNWRFWILDQKLKGMEDSLSTSLNLARRLPKALIIGARKGGTRALLEGLASHPDIRTARFEVHYFDNNSSYEKGLEWYSQQMPFALPHQLTIEKSPGYLTHALVAERVHEYNSSIKLIMIVRDPVIRTISDYTQVHYTKLAKGKPHYPLETIAYDQFGNLNVNYKPIRNSLYSLHLSNWLHYFPLSQIHIVDGDDFIINPLEHLQKIEKFLGLSPVVSKDLLYFNATKGFYCFRNSPDYYHKMWETRCLGDTKGRQHVRIGDDLRLRLKHSFRQYNKHFFDMIGREFQW